MKIAVFSLLILTILATSVTWNMSRPIFDVELNDTILNTVEISPIKTALTFARTISGDIILVASADAAVVRGINLNSAMGGSYTDAIDAYHSIELAMLERTAGETKLQNFTWSDLIAPIDEQYPHIAAGTNYKAHAEEVGHEGEPFLFPKLSHITPWNADVLNDGRMDYEVEICVVPLTEHTRNSPAQLGYLLCGDFTDRWALVKNIDTSGTMGQTGFPIAKGGESRFPIGALLVIPQETDFYKEVDIALYVNNALRQKSSGDLMIWNPSEIMSRTLADCKSPYLTTDDVVNISDCELIPARTIVLTGTPEGVMFKLPTVWNPLAYLSSGDVVITTSKYLGYMRNEITND